MRLRSTGTGYTTSVLGNGGVWRVVAPGASATGFGGQLPGGGEPGLAGLELEGGRWPTRPRQPSFATGARVTWVWESTAWSSSTASVSDISVAFNNAYWGCVFKGIPYLTFSGPDRTVYVYKLSAEPDGTNSPTWDLLWSSAAGDGADPAAWPCLAGNDDADRLLLAYVNARTTLTTVEFSSSGAGTSTVHDTGTAITTPAAIVDSSGTAVVCYARIGDVYLLQDGAGSWGDPERDAGLGAGFAAEFPSMAWTYRDVGDIYDDYRLLVLACQSTDTASADKYVSADFWFRALPDSVYGEGEQSFGPVAGRDPCCWASPDGVFYLGYTTGGGGSSDIDVATSSSPEGTWDADAAGWSTGRWTTDRMPNESRESTQNNYPNGAATADASGVCWENGNPASGVQNRTVDAAFGGPGLSAAAWIQNLSAITVGSEQAQFPCLVLLDNGTDTDVHLFWVKGQGTDQPPSIQYRFGRST